MTADLASIRKNYSHKKLLEKKAESDPFAQFSKWWKQVTEAKVKEPNAMTLATSSADGVPSARIVLLKALTPEGFVFYTNYESYKGKQLSDNPKACLVFFWKELERQVRITGLVSRVDAKLSDEYFITRPVDSQLGAIVSPQSQVIESRSWLVKKFKQLKKDLHKKDIARPENWGGYLVKPVIVEFWQGRPGRLHDRLQYSLQEDGSWKIERLAP